MIDMINISFGNATIYALLGYMVVFIGLIMLMLVVIFLGKIMAGKTKKPLPVSETPLPAAPAAPAPGSAGDLKLYDTDPKDAAMVMAIIVDSLGKPLNELRFISIKEVKNDEI